MFGYNAEIRPENHLSEVIHGRITLHAMPSGCPRHQGGASLAFQQHHVYALTSNQDNNVTVVHPQIATFATHYPEDYGLAQTARQQPDNAQSQQNSQVLYQIQKSQERVARIGLQQPKPRDCSSTLQSSHAQPRRKPNADFNSSSNFAVQRLPYFQTSANKNSVRQSAHGSGKQRECSRQHFSKHCLKGSNLNNSTGLQQMQHFNCATSIAFNRESHGATAQSSPLRDHRSTGPQHTSYPLLRAMLTRKYPGFKTPCPPPSSSSKETNTNIECSTSTNSSDERHCKSQQVKSLMGSLNCGETTTQTQDHSRATHFTPGMIPSPSHIGQPSTYKVSSVGETEPLTDDQIQEFITQRLESYLTLLTKRNGHSSDGLSFCTNDRDSTVQSTCIFPKSNSVAHLASTSASDKDDSVNRGKQCIGSVGQGLQKGSSKGSKGQADLSPKSEKTEYPQIMANITATCTKNEDESPVVLIARYGMTLDELTVKHPSCKSHQDEYKSNELNINNKNLDKMDQAQGVSWPIKHMTKKEKGDAGRRRVETVGLDNVQCVTDVSVGLDSNSRSVVTGNKTFALASPKENQGAFPPKMRDPEDQRYHSTSKEAVAHSKPTSVDQIQIHNLTFIPTEQIQHLTNETGHERMMECAGSVHSQTHSSPKVQEPALQFETQLAHTGKILKDPQYEDISDSEDMSQVLTNPPNIKHEELSQPCFEEPHYEDISEDENPQIVEMPSQTHIPELNGKRSPFEKEGYGGVQGQPQVKTEDISDELLVPKKRVSPEFKSESVPGKQTEHLVSCSPSLDETDQGDDDWIVMPLSISDLKFEPEDEAQDISEVVTEETGDEERQGDVNLTHGVLRVPSLEVETVSSQLEVFGTMESFLQAKAAQFGKSFEVTLDRSTPEHETRESHSPRNSRRSRSEPEDSSETEDSCDYSSASECNLLTVSKKFLKRRSLPLPPETDDSMSEKESDDESTNVKKARSLDKLNQVQKCRAERQRVSKKQDIIILDSDTEVEIDQHCKKTSRRLMPTGLVDGGSAPCTEEKSCEPKTEDSKYGAAKERPQGPRLSSADSSVTQQQPKHHGAQLKEEMQDARADLSLSRKTSGQLGEATSGHEHVQHKTNSKTTSRRGGNVFHGSDKVAKKSNQISNANAKRERTLPSVSNGSGDALLAIQKRPSTETVNSLSVDTVDRRGRVDTPALKSPSVTRKKTDSCEKKTWLSNRDEQARFASKRKPVNDASATKNRIKPNVEKPGLVSRQFSSPSSSTSTSGQLSEARQSSAYSRVSSQSEETTSRLTISLQSQAVPEHLSSGKLKRSYPYISSAVMGHPSSHATMQSSAKEHMANHENQSFLPTKRHRKTTRKRKEALRTHIVDSRRGARPGFSCFDMGPRQRHTSNEAIPPLMKKSRCQAQQLTKARNQDTMREHRYLVDEGHRQSEKPARAKPMTGPVRE